MLMLDGGKMRLRCLTVHQEARKEQESRTILEGGYVDDDDSSHQPRTDGNLWAFGEVRQINGKMVTAQAFREM
jgi:hypothetical protein